MARTAFAASALLSLFLLLASAAAAHRLPSEVDFLTTVSSDAAAIRLPSDKPSEESLPKTTVAEFASWDKPSVPTVAEFASWDKTSVPTVAEFAPWEKTSVPTVTEFVSWGKPSKFISKREDVATESILPAADAVAESQTVPIEVSHIPVRSFPLAHPRVVGRPSWRRLGRHCHHTPRFLRAEVRRGDFIPYGDDMVVPAEQVHRGYEGGRYFAREARAGGFHHPMTMEEVSVEDLGKLRQGFPRELRPFRKFRHHGHGEEKERGFVNRFLDLLNLH